MEQAVKQSRQSHHAIQTEIVRDLAGLARLEEEWNSLFTRACNPSPPLHHDWITTWLKVYGDRYVLGDDGLRLICCRRDGELVGLLPLYLRKPVRLADGGTHLVFISTGERIEDEVCPDYLDLLCLADVKEACARAAWEQLCRCGEMSYDRLELLDMADHSPLVKWARENGADCDLEISPRGICPISDLDGGMDAYLARLSHKTRAQCRRLLRAAEEAKVTFQVARTRDESNAFFDELVRLHQQRWRTVGEPGVFGSEPFTRFHRTLSENWVPRGMAVLSRICHDGSTIAVKYGFRCGRKFDFYQSGTLTDACPVLKSPGTASLLLLMRHLIEEGVHTFDFLRGSAQYKQRLATGAQPLVQVRRVLWTWRTSIGLAASISSRAVRKATRIATFRRSPARPQPSPQETDA